MQAENQSVNFGGIEELETELRTNGISLTSPRIQEELNRRLSVVHKNNTNRERPESYIKRRNSALAMRDVSALFMNTTFTSFAPIFGLVALIVAEIISVFYGFTVFIKEESEATSFVIQLALSIAVISVYLVFEWVYADAKIKYENNTKKDYEVNLWYLVNWVRDNFRRKELDANATSLRKYSRVRSFLILCIIIVGTLGRIGNKLNEIPNDSYLVQMEHILTKSTLVDMASYVGATLVTMSLLLGTSFIMQYQYRTYVRAVGETEINFFDSGVLNAQLEKVKMEYYKDLLAKAKLQKEKELKKKNTADQQAED